MCLSNEARGKRPFKIWDSWRNVRKGIVVNSFEELLHRGKEKLGVPQNEPVRLVLDQDGTQVEDGDYFRTLPNNTVLLLLRPGERWYPTGVDVIRAVAITAIPKIVCETIHALELHDETPSWKIMDNKGRITVVLHWDQRGGARSTGQTGSGEPSPHQKFSSPSKQKPSSLVDSSRSLVIQTSFDRKDDVYTTSGVGEYTSGGRFATTVSPQITVINHDDIIAAGKGGSSHLHHHHHPPPLGATLTANRIPTHHHAPALHRQGSGSFESTTIHIHTPECANHAHHPAASNTRSGSPSNGNGNAVIECDFHCCALHEEGRKIAVHKNVATSPIQDAQQQTSPQSSVLLAAAGIMGGGTDSRRVSSASSKGTGHVRFLDVVESNNIRYNLEQQHNENNSSESETENTIMEDEAITSEKFLLLIDQLSVDQKRHLTIKDIGIILERLSSKILDVERLDRESESDDCYNWTIKATIRGQVLRELGVIYNGNYYAISEHPGYKEENDEGNNEEEEIEEEEEEEDRL